MGRGPALLHRSVRWPGQGASTPSQTAWALLALLAAGEDGDAVDRGVSWLLDAQRADGGWDEDLYTGTGFPGDFYINYEMYRLVFPLSALGRYSRRGGGSDEWPRSSSRRCAPSTPPWPGACPTRSSSGAAWAPNACASWLPRLAELSPDAVVVAGVAGRPGSVAARG